MDSLWQLVRRRDVQHNTPKQMRTSARPVSDRKICIDCRCNPAEAAYAEYRRKWDAATPKDRERLSLERLRELPATECPACGGKLVEVTW